MKVSRRQFAKASLAGAVSAGTIGCKSSPPRGPSLPSSWGRDFWYTAEKAVVFPVGDGSVGLVKTSTDELLAIGSTPYGNDGSRNPEMRKQLPPGRLRLSRSKDKGLAWSAPVEIPAPADTSLYFGYASTAVRLPNGRILVAVSNYDHQQYLKTQNLWQPHTIHCYHSDDDGQTWHFGKPIDLPLFPLGNPLPSGELVSLGNTVVMNLTGPLTKEEAKTNGFSTVFIRSTDGGQTWSEPQILVRAGGRCLLAAEATMVALSDGRWVSFVRYHVDDARGAVCLVRLESPDEGRTWSEPTYVLYGSQPCVRNLPDGGLVLSLQAWEGVKIYFSYDGGWTFSRNLLALDPYTEDIYVNGGYWNQSLLVLDNDTILSGFCSILPGDADSRTAYGHRDGLKGFAGRLRVLRRERDPNVRVPRKIAG